MNFKKLFHRHKYTILDMYPPRPTYYSYTWGFLMECECGHSKIATLPRTIKQIHHVGTATEKEMILGNTIKRIEACTNEWTGGLADVVTEIIKDTNEKIKFKRKS
tara:strand:- start:29704 stop:30018 length:315 start_codon:yes stop_codon:yes gene_type:complete